VWLANGYRYSTLAKCKCIYGLLLSVDNTTADIEKYTRKGNISITYGTNKNQINPLIENNTNSFHPKLLYTTVYKVLIQLCNSQSYFRNKVLKIVRYLSQILKYLPIDTL
jgi:hypothetical protein